jgi:hypothetical protein
MVTVEKVETRADLAECLAHHRDMCRQFTRRGYMGVRDKRYATLHQEINELLDHYEWAEDE